MFNNWIEKKSKTVIIFLVFIALFLIFQSKFEQLFASFGGIINIDSIGFKIGFILFFLVTALLYTSLIEKKYILNNKVTFVIILIISCYFISRISNNIQFSPFTSGLKYLDILFFIFILHLILIVSAYKNDLVLNANEFFLQDVIHEGEIDNELILNKLIETTEGLRPEGSFSIGLNAAWGYGKSTFLNRFKTKYKKQNKDAIVFWYRIWKNKGSNAIIDNFFQELSRNLEPYSGEISSEIDKYVQTILNLNLSGFKEIIEAGKSVFEENQSLEFHYEKIKSCIINIDRQIIILLDDLDRLEKEEILDTYKVIRTLSDFNNIIFIAGYDRKYLEKTLGKEKENYINKIFQVELNLIPFDEKRIRDLLLNEIKKSFPITNTSSMNLKLYQGFYKIFNQTTNKTIRIEDIIFDGTSKVCSNKTLTYDLFINTYRDIKRFVNEFKFNYSFTKGEDDLIIEEYILLKLATFKYRSLQNDVFIHLDKFLSKGALDTINNKIQTGFSGYTDVYIYDSESKTKLKDLLNDYNPEEIEIINSVFCELFAEKSINYYRKHQNSITRTYYTDIYVRNNLAGAKYTISDFKKAINDNNILPLIKDIISLSFETSSHVFNELKQFILKQKFEAKEQFIEILTGLNSIMQHYYIQENEEAIDIINKAFNDFYIGKKREFIEDIKKIIEIEQIGFIEYLLRDININEKRLKRLDIYNSSNTIKYKKTPFSQTNIKNILLFKLQYLHDKSSRIDLSIEAYHLYTEAIVLDHKILRSQKANSIMRVNISKRFVHYYWQNFFDFSSDFPGEDADYHTYKPNEFLCQIFSNSTTLKKLLKDPKNEKLYLQFKTEGWKNYLKYLRSIKSLTAYSGDYDLNRLNKIIKLVEKYIDKGFKPLNYKEFIEIWKGLTTINN